MQVLDAVRQQHQELSARPLGRNLRQPRLFAAHLRHDTLITDWLALPLSGANGSVTMSGHFMVDQSALDQAPIL